MIGSEKDRVLENFDQYFVIVGFFCFYQNETFWRADLFLFSFLL